ncbi:NADH:flavin oxidoreductase [Rhodococcus sp. Chr-9]|uniref:NADH:flavin oxidoreductase n=1 Tax=Rhodococcus sp. Chr-9 TaxID=713612 RepID=UPI0005751E3D|nr:NADH:flavin oxidoreductase [Rhodococcus sp. Chr-9]KHJ74030.1 NADH:flavin oxidoreductase [Rhodococcus sp. Chr-9]
MLFDQIQLGPVDLAGRVALAPMTRVSADADGRVNERMVQYYRRFAAGGIPLLIIEGAYIDTAESQTYLYQPGLATKAHAESWRPLVDAVRAEGAAVIAQLQHSGPQGQGNPYSDRLVSASAIAARGEQMSMYRGVGPYDIPEPVTAAEIEEIHQAFVDAALRAQGAGVDGVELHGANGYLLDAFLTDYLNHRTDQYGGSTANRVRFAAETVRKVKSAVGDGFIVGIRISQGKVSDGSHKWGGGVDDADTIFRSLAEAGVDYLHTTEWKAALPAFPGEDSRPLSALAKQAAPNVTVIANGHLNTCDDADAVVLNGHADMVAIGKAALSNPDWLNRAYSGAELLDPLSPSAFGELATIQDWELQ